MGLGYVPLLWSLFMQHLQILKMHHVFATCASTATCWSHPSLWTWCYVSGSYSRLYFKPCSNCHSSGLWLCAVTWFQSMLDKGNIPKHLYPGLSCSTLLRSSLAARSSVLCAALFYTAFYGCFVPLKCCMESSEIGAAFTEDDGNTAILISAILPFIYILKRERRKHA